MLKQVISNKTGWTRVAFGEVVRLSKLRAKHPEAEGYERVVGLEHIEPGDLRIRRWADIADGTTFTSVFKPGQVLFGKRRAYQRKVAVADFAGVCSGDIYVLEPSSDTLMPELLPFICQTDAFFDHAVGTSAGSLSPRTNWKSLATFEFLLPPIQEQARLIEILHANKAAVESLDTLLSSLRQMRSSLLKTLIGPAEPSPEDYPDREFFSLGELSKVVRGSTPRPAGDPRYFRGDYIPWVTVGEITKNDRMHISSTEESLTESGSQKSRVIPSGTVVLSNSGWTLGVPKILQISVCANDGVAAFLDLDERVDPMFLYYRLFGLTAFLRQVIAAGGDQPNLNTDRIASIQIALPSRKTQAEIVENISSVQKLIDETWQRHQSNRSLMSGFLGDHLRRSGDLA
jgi:type I restriction enzyme S subunit